MTTYSRDTAERDSINASDKKFATIRERKRQNRIVITDEITNEIILDVDEERALAIMMAIDDLMVRWSEPMDIVAHTSGMRASRKLGPNWSYNESTRRLVYKES